jgi:hypothetical protein
LLAFLFDAKGAKRKAIGQKHSRLGRKRVARFRYSLFFSISTSASSSTGRAEAQITKEKANKKKTPFWKGYSPLHPRHLLKKTFNDYVSDIIK